MLSTLRVPATLALSVLVLQPAAFAAPLRHKPIYQNQATGLPQTAPVPPQIAAAHTVFVANGGADHNFPGTGEEAYNDVYAALQQWGHYQLVSSPSQADLIFKLQDIAPVTDVRTDTENAESYAITSPAFRLTLLDAHSNAELWTITSPVNRAWRKKERVRWYGIAVANLVSRVKVVAGQPLTSAETANLTLAPRRNYAGFYIAGGVVAAGLAGGLILHHEFENNVAAQNAAACKQNTIFCTAAVSHP